MLYTNKYPGLISSHHRLSSPRTSHPLSQPTNPSSTRAYKRHNRKMPCCTTRCNASERRFAHYSMPSRLSSLMFRAQMTRCARSLMMSLLRQDRELRLLRLLVVADKKKRQNWKEIRADCRVEAVYWGHVMNSESCGTYLCQRHYDTKLFYLACIAASTKKCSHTTNHLIKGPSLMCILCKVSMNKQYTLIPTL
jgi:hypothetical protein